MERSSLFRCQPRHSRACIRHPRAAWLIRIAALLAPLFVLSLGPAGCSTDAPGTPIYDERAIALSTQPREMRVVSSFGGAHRALLIDDGKWYQCFANRLLILEAATGTLISDVELAPRGTTGPATDLVLLDGRLFVLLDRDAVVELDVSAPRTPRFVARWGRRELGILPMHLSLVRSEVFVCGGGGAVRLSDAETDRPRVDAKGKPIPPVVPDPFLRDMEVRCVVDAKDGPVACVGRRILRLTNGEFLGAASMLLPVPDELGGGYAFVLQASEAAQIGLMGDDFRERSSSAMQGVVRALRLYDDRLLAVTLGEIDSWNIAPEPGRATTVRGEGTQLGMLIAVRVKGAFDIGKVKRNRFAVAGSFGRSLYRFLPEGDQPADTFYWAERAPGKLDVSLTDRRRILAASDEGSWLYLIEDEAELVERDIASPDAQSPRAEVAWGSASCEEPRAEVVFRVGEREITMQPSREGKISTIVAADGRIWVGHDHGIDVYGYDSATAELVAEDRIVLAGPIIAIYPSRVGGGVSYVSRFDGFGVIRPVPRTDPPILQRGCVRGYPLPGEESAESTRRSGASGRRAGEVR